jgi:hypothetical protein
MHFSYFPCLVQLIAFDLIPVRSECSMCECDVNFSAYLHTCMQTYIQSPKTKNILQRIICLMLVLWRSLKPKSSLSQRCTVRMARTGPISLLVWCAHVRNTRAPIRGYITTIINQVVGFGCRSNLWDSSLLFPILLGHVWALNVHVGRSIIEQWEQNRFKMYTCQPMILMSQEVFYSVLLNAGLGSFWHFESYDGYFLRPVHITRARVTRYACE